MIYFNLAEPWTGEWRGMNVIFDLGIFLGECVIARNKRLHWEYQPGGRSDGRPANSTGYGLRGFRHPKDHLDPPGYIYSECGNDQADFINNTIGRSVAPHYLVGTVRDFSTR